MSCDYEIDHDDWSGENTDDCMQAEMIVYKHVPRRS